MIIVIVLEGATNPTTTEYRIDSFEVARGYKALADASKEFAKPIVTGPIQPYQGDFAKVGYEVTEGP